MGNKAGRRSASNRKRYLQRQAEENLAIYTEWEQRRAAEAAARAERAAQPAPTTTARPEDAKG
jgi:hypothetical protein